MKRIPILLTIVSLATLLAFAGCSGEKKTTTPPSKESARKGKGVEKTSPLPPKPTALKANDRIPEDLVVRLLVRDGKETGNRFEEKPLLEAMGGKHALLFYTIVGNALCEKTLLEVEQFLQESAFPNIAPFLVVNIREGEKREAAKDPITPDDVERRADLLDIEMPIILDRNYQLGHLLGIRTAPSMTILHRDGTIRIVDATALRQMVMPGKRFEDYLREGAKNDAFPAIQRMPHHYPARELIGSRYLDFALPTLDGEVHPLREAFGKGKVVLLTFWRVNCPHCQREIPKLNEFYRAHENEVTVVSVMRANDEAMKRRSRAFLEKHRIAFPALVDQGNQIFRLYGVISTPTTLVMTPDGQIKAVFVYAVDFEKVIGSRLRELREAG
ncbi:MAG: hypothetical protein D6812_15465 [Deltaproteobacteria bacterium]|nr:MAG: hypothetical protein D6812_15465 [Deltaproteobacteria bacterium]